MASILKLVELRAHAELEATRTALNELVAHTREESGCLRFEVYESGEDPGLFILLEHFISQAAFQAHLETDYTCRYFEAGWTRPERSVSLNPVTDCFSVHPQDD